VTRPRIPEGGRHCGRRTRIDTAENSMSVRGPEAAPMVGGSGEAYEQSPRTPARTGVRRPERGQAQGSIGPRGAKSTPGTDCPRRKTQEPRRSARGRSQFASGCVVFERPVPRPNYRGGRFEKRQVGAKDGNVRRSAGRSNTAKGMNPMSAAGTRSWQGRGDVRLGSGTPSRQRTSTVHDLNRTAVREA